MLLVCLLNIPLRQHEKEISLVKMHGTMFVQS